MKLKLASVNEVKAYREKAKSIRNHSMFSSAAGIAVRAVTEWLASQDGKTVYPCMAEKEVK